MDPDALLGALKAGRLPAGLAGDPLAAATVELAQWLAYPTELDRYPDEIAVVDARTLQWPPAGRALPLTLLRYRVIDEYGLAPDDVGVGLVGSVTFCLFSYAAHRRPPEDAYALHCYWECLTAKLISEVSELATGAVEAALASAGIVVENPRGVLAVRVSPGLGYPGGEVMLVSGERDGAAGWWVCDGPASSWYAAAEMPHAPPAAAVMIHVGRRLLGFVTHGIERARFNPPDPVLDDAEFLRRYERALTAARAASTEARAEAMGLGGPILFHGRRYVALLTAAERVAEIGRLINELAPHLDHNSGYAALGELAYGAGLFNVSQRFIEQLRASYAHHYRSETMALLARIYARQGRRDEAVSLLRACIDRVDADEQCTPREKAAFAAPSLAALAELAPPEPPEVA